MWKAFRCSSNTRTTKEKSELTCARSIEFLVSNGCFCRDNSINTNHRYDALVDPSNSLLCPIRLILTHALRIGAIAATSFEGVMGLIRANRTKTLPWTHPEWPLLCKIRGPAFLCPSEPAYYSQLANTLEAAAEKAGIIDQLRSHDLRRGFIRDVAHLPKSDIAGVASRAVADAAGHSGNSLNFGVTDRYIGGIGHDIHTDRVENPTRNDGRLIHTDAARPYKRTRTASQAVDRRIVESGMDATDRLHRKRAATALRKERKDRWRTQSLLSPDDQDSTPVPIGQ